MRIRLNTYLACVIVFLCASTECIYPQKLKWNFGLSRKQSSEVIPHSKHSFQTAKPKKKVVEPGEFEIQVGSASDQIHFVRTIIVR